MSPQKATELGFTSGCDWYDGGVCYACRIINPTPFTINYVNSASGSGGSELSHTGLNVWIMPMATLAVIAGAAGMLVRRLRA